MTVVDLRKEYEYVTGKEYIIDGFISEEYTRWLEFKLTDNNRKSHGFIALAESDIKFKFSSLEKARKYTLNRTDNPIIIELLEAKEAW